MSTIYTLSLMALFVSLAQVFLGLIENIPLRVLYYHYKLRKILLIGLALMTAIKIYTDPHLATWYESPALGVFIIFALSFLATIKLHQENIFRAIDFPHYNNAAATIIGDEEEVAIIEYMGTVHALPLKFVAHHHIVNDRFIDIQDPENIAKIISLTFCPMCHTIIALDTTELGPLFVSGFANGNLVFSDRKTKTFFQQATYESAAGPLHPRKLDLYPVQILPWGLARISKPEPVIAKVTQNDLKDFELPIKGIWRKILQSEFVPGIRTSSKDPKYASREMVISIRYKKTKIGIPKKDLLAMKIYENNELVLFVKEEAFLGFVKKIGGKTLNLKLKNDKIVDAESKTTWDFRGKYLKGPLKRNLELVPVSNEYWYAWRKFHPEAKLVLAGSIEKNQ